MSIEFYWCTFHLLCACSNETMTAAPLTGPWSFGSKNGIPPRQRPPAPRCSAVSHGEGLAWKRCSMAWPGFQRALEPGAQGGMCRRPNKYVVKLHNIVEGGLEVKLPTCGCSNSCENSPRREKVREERVERQQKKDLRSQRERERERDRYVLYVYI